MKMWNMSKKNLYHNYIMDLQKVCVFSCLLILVLVIFLIVKKRNCPCSNVREGFESDGISNEIMAQIHNIENEINQKLNDHENRISKLENS